ncbi:MAG TPA: DegT/DnrJ/EryC1/StrS family aminotransferase [Sphingobium sp.]
MNPLVLLGGNGFIGTVTTRRLAGRYSVVVMDRQAAGTTIEPALRASFDHIEVDLAQDETELPAGTVVVMIGESDVRPLHLWTHFRDNCVPIMRLADQLRDRAVVLLSSVEVYGTHIGPIDEQTHGHLSASEADLSAWCDYLLSKPLGGDCDIFACSLFDAMSGRDPDGRWTYALAKRLQEMMLSRLVAADRLHILRLGNVFGVGQHRVLSRFVTRALLGEPLHATDTSRSFVPVDQVAEAIERCVDGTIPAGCHLLGGLTSTLPTLGQRVIDHLDSAAPLMVCARSPDEVPRDVRSTTLASLLTKRDVDAELSDFIRTQAMEQAPLGKSVNVVQPPRPFRPDVVAARQTIALRSGALKYGNRWTQRLTEQLSERLELGPDRMLLLTNSGTSALRMAIVATVGAARPGDIAVLPSFSFAATAEVLAQLGYRLRFCDIDSRGWTLDPAHLRQALLPGDCKLVVGVDALGNPMDYVALQQVCAEFGVPLIADSAPSLGAAYHGRPVGNQTAAHAFSMSFAKGVSAGGAGGCLILDTDRVAGLSTGPNWWRSSQMTELAAIVALDLVEQLDVLVERRRAVAEIYASLERLVQPQRITTNASHGWVHWAACFPGMDRDRVADDLARLGIGTKPYYAPALHRLDWEGMAESGGDLTTTDRICADVLALPMSSEMTVGEAEQIALAVTRVVQKNVTDANIMVPPQIQVIAT